jgi:hypothetical protein
MKTFLIIYGCVVIVGFIAMYIGMKNAVEVPQDIDIYEL